MNFVESAVLESTDGVSFKKESQVTKTDTSLTPNRAFTGGPAKSLRDQLLENKQKQDEEFKKSHNPFQPPAALNAEEISFYQEKADERRQAEQARLNADQLAKSLFQQELLAARLRPVQAEPVPEAPQPAAAAKPKPDSKAAAPMPVVVKAVARRKDGKPADRTNAPGGKQQTTPQAASHGVKRKAGEDSTSAPGAGAAESESAPKRAKPAAATSKTAANKPIAPNPAGSGGAATGLALLGQYDDAD